MLGPGFTGVAAACGGRVPGALREPAGIHVVRSRLDGACVPDWGPGPYADVMSALDAMLERPYADPQRVGITGGSYGGYLASYSLGQTDRFKAAVILRVAFDLAVSTYSVRRTAPVFGTTGESGRRRAGQSMMSQSPLLTLIESRRRRCSSTATRTQRRRLVKPRRCSTSSWQRLRHRARLLSPVSRTAL